MQGSFSDGVEEGRGAINHRDEGVLELLFRACWNFYSTLRGPLNTGFTYYYPNIFISGIIKDNHHGVFIIVTS